MAPGAFDKRSGDPVGTPAQERVEQTVFSLQQLTQSPQLFERFPYGLALADSSDGALYLNCRARELLVPAASRSNRSPWTCCELICDRLGMLLGGGCMTERAIDAEAPLPELRMDLGDGPSSGGAWVTVSQLDESRLLFHLRPGVAGDRRRKTFVTGLEERIGDEAELRISTLGTFQVEGMRGSMGGKWLEQRPGQLFKYLVCRRGELVASDQIAEAFWPEAAPEEARNRLRYYVHCLREGLEPERTRRSPSLFIKGRRGGYLLDTDRVWLDVDEFQREARAGLAAFVQGLPEPAAAHLDVALRLYRGSFLAEDPYAEWTFAEREHLHELVGRALRAQVRIRIELGQLDEAADHARQLAELEPFDMDVQRMFLDVCLRRGRRSEALRRYSALRKRMLRSFNQEPDFDLSEVEASLN